MKKDNMIKPFVGFLSAAILGLMITVVGLRLYFNDFRLQERLTRSYSAEAFEVLAGQAEINNDTLLFSGLKPEGYGYASIDKLHIDTRFYQQLSVTFAEKHASQPLLLMVRNDSNHQVPEQLVLHGEQLTTNFLVEDLAPIGTVITDVGLLADRLFAPYRLQSIQFIPKTLNNQEFAQLLISCFAINTEWQGVSINTRPSPHEVFVSPKVLLLLYFCVVGLLFAAYLRFTRQPMLNAWWVTLIVAWLALDIHYLFEKTTITNNVYSTFAPLSEVDKNWELSPKAAKLAQMIQSVLPNDGRRKKIRIQFGWKRLVDQWEYQLPENHYLVGKLHYLLKPNLLYTFTHTMPPEVWATGGFYYVDAGARREWLKYDAENGVLLTAMGQKVFAKRLLNNKELAVYDVKGVRSLTKEQK